MYNVYTGIRIANAVESNIGKMNYSMDLEIWD